MAGRPIDLDRVHVAHRRFAQRNRQVIDQVLADRIPEAQAHVREHAPFKHRSGAAWRGVRGRLVRTRGGTVLRLSNEARHAKYLEFGTRAHRIVARRKKALSFFWLRVSKAMVLKAVNHPGTRPYFFMRAAAVHAHAQINPALRAALGRVASSF